METEFLDNNTEKKTQLNTENNNYQKEEKPQFSMPVIAFRKNFSYEDLIKTDSERVQKFISTSKKSLDLQKPQLVKDDTLEKNTTQTFNKETKSFEENEKSLNKIIDKWDTKKWNSQQAKEKFENMHNLQSEVVLTNAIKKDNFFKNIPLQLKQTDNNQNFKEFYKKNLKRMIEKSKDRQINEFFLNENTKHLIETEEQYQNEKNNKKHPKKSLNSKSNPLFGNFKKLTEIHQNKEDINKHSKEFFDNFKKEDFENEYLPEIYLQDDNAIYP